MLMITMFTSALNRTNNLIDHVIVSFESVRSCPKAKTGWQVPIRQVKRMDGNDKDNFMPIDYWYHCSFLQVVE